MNSHIQLDLHLHIKMNLLHIHLNLQLISGSRGAKEAAAPKKSEERGAS